MTLEERVAALEAQMTSATQADPTEYYTSVYSGEQIDQAVGYVLNGIFIIPSSTSGSQKKFKITVDDAGTITATGVTGT
mgnify:FL=1